MAGNSMGNTPARIGKTIGKGAVTTLKTAKPQGVLGAIGAAGAAAKISTTGSGKSKKK